ncbi:hypothetical protein ACJ72_08845 [Emergomyces africanus]|uniref:Uncharacterized protein n=1 Tax=Emergomyces africanus TaxID=1955775 RepID=A0A1B7NJH5_9EURO|nr:hypothetical protein ACJ72_08845 [Emergomyces africanus]
MSLMYDSRSSLVSVEQLRFPVHIEKGYVNVMFNEEAEINIILKSVTMNLNLSIQCLFLLPILRAEGHRSEMIDVCINISVTINKIIIYQMFFMMKKDANKCLLDQSFENAVRLARCTDNQEQIIITVYHSNDSQISQSLVTYSSDDHRDRTLNQMQIS